VVTLFILVFISTVLDCLVIRDYLVVNFGNYLTLSVIDSKMAALTLISLIVVVISDLCFATRIWRLQRVHWGFVAAIVVTAMGSLASGLVLVDSVFRHTNVTSLAGKTDMISVACVNISTAVSQAIATGCLWYSFRAHIQEAGRTDPLVVVNSSADAIAALLHDNGCCVSSLVHVFVPPRSDMLRRFSSLNARYSTPSDSFRSSKYHDSGIFANGLAKIPGLMASPQRVPVEALSSRPFERLEERSTPFTVSHSVESRTSERSYPAVRPATQDLIPEFMAVVIEPEGECHTLGAAALGAGKDIVRTTPEKGKEVEISAPSPTLQPLRRLPANPV
ncbi:hypothetical protein V5O48_017141, partial [Marasmius crinis-equi]